MQNGQHYVHELRQISLSRGMYHFYFVIFLFHFYFGIRSISSVINVSIVSNVSIVKSISSESNVSVVCSSNLML